MTNSCPKILRGLLVPAKKLNRTIKGRPARALERENRIAYQNELAAKSSEDLAAWMDETLACLPDRSESQESRLTKPKFRLTQKLDQELLVVISYPFFPPPRSKAEVVATPLPDFSPQVSPSTVGLFHLKADSRDHALIDLGGLKCMARRRSSSSA